MFGLTPQCLSMLRGRAVLVLSRPGERSRRCRHPLPVSSCSDGRGGLCGGFEGRRPGLGLLGARRLPERPPSGLGRPGVHAARHHLPSPAGGRVPGFQRGRQKPVAKTTLFGTVEVERIAYRACRACNSAVPATAWCRRQGRRHLSGASETDQEPDSASPGNGYSGRWSRGDRVPTWSRIMLVRPSSLSPSAESVGSW